MFLPNNLGKVLTIKTENKPNYLFVVSGEKFESISEEGELSAAVKVIKIFFASPYSCLALVS
jgi:hypothetical protein